MARNLHQYYSEVFMEQMSSRVYQRRQVRTPIYVPVLIGLLVLAVVLFYIWQRVQVVKLGYQIEKYKIEKVELVRKNKELLIEVSSLTSPDRIERLASHRVGLSAPDREQIVIVKRVTPSVPSEEQGDVKGMVARFSNILTGNRS
ncbi:MAG: cell division protein FtsL [Nitrospirota bacterium]|nr:cell division protein FtsL [Nitrospirota bacterium]